MENALDNWSLLPGVTFGLLLVLTFLYKISKKSSKHFPPGPYPLPLLGTIYKHGVNIKADTLTELSTIYGDVFSVFLGPQRYVILSSYEAIYEAMTRPGEFSHRGLADKYTWRLIRTDAMHGLFPKDYHEELIRDRNSSIAIMRKLGMGKTVIEDKILLEIASVVSVLSEMGDKQLLNPRDLIHTSIGNVTLHILLNKRFEHGDKKVQHLLEHMDNFINNITYTTLIDSMPSLRFIPPFSGILQKFVSGSLGVCEFMKTHSKPMFGKFDPDCTDSFVQRFFESKYKHDTNEIDVDLDVFKYILGDLLTGGVETSATGIRWTMIYLANRQTIQEKLYNEIAANTEADQPVRIADKERLPYLEAVVWEIQRHCNIVPLLIHKSCGKDVQLRGYCIPGNTMLLLNIHATHMNEITWGDPLVFRPERFIDDDGKFVKHPNVIPFSIGKRACPGEILARQELYLFTANLVKKFRFRPPEGIAKISEEPIKRGTWCPKPFKVNVVAR